MVIVRVHYRGGGTVPCEGGRSAKLSGGGWAPLDKLRVADNFVCSSPGWHVTFCFRSRRDLTTGGGGGVQIEIFKPRGGAEGGLISFLTGAINRGRAFAPPAPTCEVMGDMDGKHFRFELPLIGICLKFGPPCFKGQAYALRRTPFNFMPLSLIFHCNAIAWRSNSRFDIDTINSHHPRNSSTGYRLPLSIWLQCRCMV